MTVHTQDTVIVNTTDLIVERLDWAVSTALNYKPFYNTQFKGWWLQVAKGYKAMPKYSSNEVDGGLVISKEHISTLYAGYGCWCAEIKGKHTQIGPTQLIAAMRCFVRSRLGNKVSIPVKLM